VKIILPILLLAISLAATAAEMPAITLTPSNSVTLRGEITQESVDKAVTEVLLLDSKRTFTTPIYLVLDSPGGDISAGESLIEALKTVQNLNTVTIFAASMASAIVEALPGRRYIIESGMLMFHRARGGFQGQFETGELETRLTMAKQEVLRLERRNAKRLGLKLEEYKAKIQNEMWIQAENSIEQKAADKIVALKCSRDLLKVSETMTMNLGIFSIKFKVSKCPLIKSGTPDTDEDAKNLKEAMSIVKKISNSSKQGASNGK